MPLLHIIHSNGARMMRKNLRNIPGPEVCQGYQIEGATEFVSKRKKGELGVCRGTDHSRGTSESQVGFDSWCKSLRLTWKAKVSMCYEGGSIRFASYAVGFFDTVMELKDVSFGGRSPFSQEHVAFLCVSLPVATQFRYRCLRVPSGMVGGGC